MGLERLRMNVRQSVLRTWPLYAAVLLLLPGGTVRADDPDRRTVIREMLDRSRLLEDAHFTVPVELYLRYARQRAAPPAAPPPPVPVIAEEGAYHLRISDGREVRLAARLRLIVLDRAGAVSIDVLSHDPPWEEVKVNGAAARLPIVDGFLLFAPDKPGIYEITAEAPLGKLAPEGRQLRVAIAKTVRTLLRFDAPGAWDVSGDQRDTRKIRGESGKGTHGQLALTPRTELVVRIKPFQEERERPPRYRFGGDVVWNFDAGVRRVAARLDVAILGGRSERIDLTLPRTAERVSIDGPDVREVRLSPGAASVFLRGKIADKTRLNVRYELPAGEGGAERIERIEIRDGSWSGGTLVVTNTAGASEVLPGSMNGLRELTVSEIPASAGAILQGQPVLAYEITSRRWSAEVELIDLGEFALRESIADLAHFRVLLTRDGTMLCKVRYEIRNRGRQFLRIELPAGSQVLAGRVNDKSQPVSPAGEPDTWLLPLVRSTASVMGLVSFPVEVVFLSRTTPVEGHTAATLPLPRVDLPIAYAWAELYAPDGMAVRKWSGPMRSVEQYSSETAIAHLGYGRGELAEGYEPRHRDLPVLNKVPIIEAAKPTTAPAGRITLHGGDASAILGRNYFRAGAEFYQRSDYNNARESLQKVLELSPKSTEAANAKRLLANIKLLRGELALDTRAQRAAGRTVRHELHEANVELLRRQRQYVTAGEALARAGKDEEARTQLQAAEATTRQLAARGVKVGRTSNALIRLQMQMQATDAREQVRTQRLRERVEKLKAGGQYERALEESKKLRRRRGYRGGDEIGREMEELAVLAAKKRSSHTSGEHLSVPRLDEGGVPVVGRLFGRAYVSDLESAIQDPTPYDTTVSALEPDAQRAGQTIAALTTRAQELLSEQRYGQSLEVVRQILKLDPDNAWARSRVDLLEEFALLQENRKVHAQAQSDEQGVPVVGSGFIQLPSAGRVPATSEDMSSDLDPVEIRRAESPWWDLIKYPSDWKDLTLRREPFSAGKISESAADRQVRQQLQSRIPTLDLPDLGLEDVIEFMRELSTLNFHVKWAALEMAGIDKSTTVNVRLANVTVGKALETILDDVGRVGDPLGYVIDEGVITISTKDDLSARTLTRVYDIRDLIVRVPNFVAPSANLGGGTRGNRGAGTGGGGGFGGRGEKSIPTTGDIVSNITDLITTTIDERSWRPAGGFGSIRELGGQLVVTQTAENHKALMDLIAQLREARGPHVQEGERIAEQRAKGILVDRDGDGLSLSEADLRQLRQFVGANYDWAREGGAGGRGGALAWRGDGPTAADDIAAKLKLNLAQKIHVNSLNLNVDARAAERLGVRFRKGANDVRYSIIDEAQFRSLNEVAAGNPILTPEANASREQETIVGTDALLANRMIANAFFAGDRSNTLDIASNTIELPHEKYVLIDSNGYLTAVRAGAMQHWQEKTEYVRFAEAPQSIDVPRAGRLVKFEKTLVNPTDRLVLKAEYTWEGEKK